MTIPLRDIIRTGPPSIDRRAITFELDGLIFRALTPEASGLFRRLLDADWLPDLFESGLVRFRRADIRVEGYDLVLEVDRVRIVSYPPEWPTAMLRSAGATIARLGKVLADHGLGFVDAHPWNILFEGPRPVFVDLGSIVEASRVSWDLAREFRRHMVVPLALHRVGLHQLADAVQRTPRGGWTARFDGTVARAFPPRYFMMRRDLADPSRFYGRLADYMATLDSANAGSRWSSYYESDEPVIGNADRYNEKHRAVNVLLDRLPAGSVLDVGANAGWYSQLAASKGHQVTALDLDDRALSSLYLSAAQQGLDILPLRMDILWPTGSSGLGLEYRAAPDRLASDVVLALAVLHHIVGGQGMTFQVFARVMDLFANRHAIVEFIPAEDTHVATWPLASAAWYDAAHFVDAMSPFFRLVERFPSTPYPREILHFERS